MKYLNNTILEKIEKICGHMDESILFSLLLLRHLSQDTSSHPALTRINAEQTDGRLWEIILANQANTYMASITKALSAVEPLFPCVHTLIGKNVKQPVREEELQQLICLLSDISPDDLPCIVIFENHLGKKHPSSSAASSCGDFYTPKSIAQCLSIFLDPVGGTVYDPCCGSGSLLFAAQAYSKRNLALYGQTQDEASYLRSQIYSILNGMYIDLGREPANTLLKDQHKDKKFDYIITNPPFNHANWCNGGSCLYDDKWLFGIPPRSNANFAWLQLIISHLKPGGRAAVILPNGSLTTQIYSEAAIREAMIKSNLIEAIIALPPGLFYSTKVPCCIWLLTNGGQEHKEILFIDAAHMKPAIKKDIAPEHMERLEKLLGKYRQGNPGGSAEWYGTASLETITKNEFVLSPNLYTAIPRPEPSEIRKGYKKLLEVIDKLSIMPVDETLLSSIVAWKNANMAKCWEKTGLLQIYHASGGVTKSKSFFGKGTPLLDVKTVIHSPYMPGRFSSSVEVTEDEKIKYGIKYGDVLLNRSSETIKELACCCVALENYDAVYGGFMKRLRPRNDQAPEPLYAACYFRSEIYRWAVEKVSTVFTTYATINNQKLSKIDIYFPDIETQKKIGRTVFDVFHYRKQCSDELQKHLLKEFERLLIQQYITYPILCIQNKDGDNQCR